MDEAKRGVSLQMKMLIGFLVGLGTGLIVYQVAPDAAWADTLRTYVTGPVGQIFLRLLFMLVIPLLFSALVIGIAEMGDVRALKRIGLKTLVFTIGISAVAVVIALAVANLFNPGAGVDPAAAQAMLADSREGVGAILS
ncbi:MAG: cation:dicarboxylate symporter family transporter, partial [Allosphingosinicella sp.]